MMNDIIIFCANYLLIFVILVAAVAWLRLERAAKVRFLLTAFLGCAIAFILSRIASGLYYDPRPFVVNHVAPLLWHGADNGFPSDHALITMTLTAVTYFYNKKLALLMFVLSLFVALARMLALLHFPVDIAGAWVLALAGAVAGYYLGRWLLARFMQRRNNQVPRL